MNYLDLWNVKSLPWLFNRNLLTEIKIFFYCNIAIFCAKMSRVNKSSISITDIYLSLFLFLRWLLIIIGNPSAIKDYTFTDWKNKNFFKIIFFSVWIFSDLDQSHCFNIWLIEVYRIIWIIIIIKYYFLRPEKKVAFVYFVVESLSNPGKCMWIT
jgi:hypothetical protein